MKNKLSAIILVDRASDLRSAIKIKTWTQLGKEDEIQDLQNFLNITTD